MICVLSYLRSRCAASLAAMAGALLLLAATGCGPKVTLSPEFRDQPPKVLAVLPVKAPDSVREERVRYFRSALSSELRNAGFYLIDDAIVSRVCSDADCMERKALAERYNVDAFVLPTIDSNSRNNFGLGFYNEVTGTIRIENGKQKEIASVSHTQSKRGGLVFQSGQVIEGLREQYTNFGDDGFNLLADKFADTVVDELPEPEELEQQAQTVGRLTAEISSAEAVPIRPGVYRICLDGTPNAIASLVVRRIKSSLREVQSGHYCGIFSESTGLGKGAELVVELRSAFGNPVRVPLSLAAGAETVRSAKR